jgi:hypothetical protein
VASLSLRPTQLDMSPAAEKRRVLMASPPVKPQRYLPGPVTLIPPLWRFLEHGWVTIPE